jgi:hypothetical protein
MLWLPRMELCGGLAIETRIWNCLSFCCNQPSKCSRVCRNNPTFAFRVHEVGGFELDLPRGPALRAPMLPAVAPEVFHGFGRTRPFAPGTATLSLYRVFDRRSGQPRFSGPKELCDHLRVAEGTRFVLVGIQRDKPLERWWELGKEKRYSIIKSAQNCGAILVTSPNYSLFLDRPRWDDLHAIKRIAWTHQEFLDAGLPAALHVNGRTETDFKRWAEYIVAHPEVQHVSYEFTTGTGRLPRRAQHVAWLCQLARLVGRPLHLLARGGLEVIPQLCTAFSGVTFLDTSSFLKTMMRFRAINGETIGWWIAPTAVGEPLDDLLDLNWDISRNWISRNIAHHINARSREVAIA